MRPTSSHLSWIFVALAAGLGVFFFFAPTEQLPTRYEQQRVQLAEEDVIPLSELLRRAGLEDHRLLEVELEREHGRIVYELELLDDNGRVRERYFDAVTGEPLQHDH